MEKEILIYHFTFVVSLFNLLWYAAVKDLSIPPGDRLRSSLNRKWT